ncbi:MAG: DivIVA domain-containing protein, partial [Clostridiales bacterium]|nr:DivIVA domain-containing protein [Candidatus Apopatocola equi]
MITAQNIREKTFDKATFGGYDMTGVDDYLEELAADVTATQKEIATLRGKMKVLVDKIEEYRANEDAMRMALVSAQKLSAQIEEEANARARAILDEARAQADAMVAEAQAKVDAVTGDLTELRTLEERRLSAAKEANTAYFEKAFANLERQNEILRAIQA